MEFFVLKVNSIFARWISADLIHGDRRRSNILLESLSATTELPRKEQIKWPLTKHS